MTKPPTTVEEFRRRYGDLTAAADDKVKRAMLTDYVDRGIRGMNGKPPRKGKGLKK